MTSTTKTQNAAQRMFKQEQRARESEVRRSEQKRYERDLSEKIRRLRELRLSKAD